MKELTSKICKIVSLFNPSIILEMKDNDSEQQTIYNILPGVPKTLKHCMKIFLWIKAMYLSIFEKFYIFLLFYIQGTVDLFTFKC